LPKRHALDEIAACQIAADEKRQKEAERQQRDAVASQAGSFSNRPAGKRHRR
jgi:hypothetical protein